MDIEILNATTNKSLGFCKVTQETSIGEVRKIIYETLGGPAPAGQLLRLDMKDNKTALADHETIGALNLTNGSRLYLKDLGLQISWRLVFIIEYMGALTIYQWFYLNRKDPKNSALVVDLAAACMLLHYLKRLYESLYVHRFSHATMPLRCLFTNCAYYWSFTAYIGWDINDRWFVGPSYMCMWTGWAVFLLCEIGNFSVHLALRDLRPVGTNVRRIPMPNRNLFTKLFNKVSCPNYTYEVGAWLAFAAMTTCVAAFIFAAAGAYQMSKWALKKQQQYLMEFENYPNQRRAIFPYIL